MATGIPARVKAITKDRDYASQLTSILTEQELTDDEAKKVFETLDLTTLQKDLSFLTALNEVAKYEGFNPREIIKLLLTAHTRLAEQVAADPELEDTITADISVGDATTKFEFTNNEAFRTDMQFLCLMFITRGAAYDKIMKKSSKVMKACMNLLKVKYNINTTKRRPGQTVDAGMITIPRIAASFPSITVGLFHRGFGRSIVDPNVLFPDTALPRALYSPMMPSLIPQHADAPLAILLAIAVRTDDILHQTEAKTGLGALHQYLLASYNSTAMTEPVKHKCCANWGIIDRPNGGIAFKQEIIAARARAKVLIRESRPNDPTLEAVLGQV